MQLMSSFGKVGSCLHLRPVQHCAPIHTHLHTQPHTHTHMHTHTHRHTNTRTHSGADTSHLCFSFTPFTTYFVIIVVLAIAMLWYARNSTMILLFSVTIPSSVFFVLCGWVLSGIWCFLWPDCVHACCWVCAGKYAVMSANELVMSIHRHACNRMPWFSGNRVNAFFSSCLRYAWGLECITARICKGVQQHIQSTNQLVVSINRLFHSCGLVQHFISVRCGDIPLLSFTCKFTYRFCNHGYSCDGRAL